GIVLIMLAPSATDFGWRVPLNNDWRPQATIAITCVVLLPLWVVVCLALAKSGGAEGWWGIAMLGASCLIVAVGIASAISGARRGSRASRTASKVCLSVLLLMIATVVVFLWWLSKQRFA